MHTSKERGGIGASRCIFEWNVVPVAAMAIKCDSHKGDSHAAQCPSVETLSHPTLGYLKLCINARNDAGFVCISQLFFEA